MVSHTTRLACYAIPRCPGPSHPDTEVRYTGDNDTPSLSIYLSTYLQPTRRSSGCSNGWRADASERLVGSIRLTRGCGACRVIACRFIVWACREVVCVLYSREIMLILFSRAMRERERSLIFCAEPRAYHNAPPLMEFVLDFCHAKSQGPGSPMCPPNPAPRLEYA